MAIEKRELGTQDNPDINVGGSAVEVFPEPTRQDQIREAAEILVTEEEILIGDEMDIQDPLPEQIPHSYSS